MTNELLQFLNSKYILRAKLSSVIPEEAVDYIINLIVADLAHYKNITNSKENNLNS